MKVGIYLVKSLLDGQSRRNEGDDKELMGHTPHAVAANWLWGWIIERFVTV